MNLCLRISITKLLEANVKTINQTRYYARWSHRRPRRVLTTTEEYEEIENKYEELAKSNGEEKIIELQPDIMKQSLKTVKQKENRSKWIPKTVREQFTPDVLEAIDKLTNIPLNTNPKKKKVSYKTKEEVKNIPTDMLETVIDANGDFIYTKLKGQDPIIGQVMIMAKSRNEQVKKNLILLEGKRLIKEALETQCKLNSLIFSRKSDVEYLKPYLPKSGAKLYKIPYKEIQMWSNLTTSPGIMGIFQSPEVEKYTPPIGSLNLTVICDNIREPGNLGTVLRTAAAVGVQNVLLTKGCVDLWDTKVLRSACGAHFRLQIHKKMDWTDIEQLLSNQEISVLVADNNIITESIDNLTDSSNVEVKPPETKSLKEVLAEMPLLPYYGLNFDTSRHFVLILGGETEGISDNSYHFASNFNGVRLNIPLSNNIESLNSGTALGIITFEIKRQLAMLDDKIMIKMQNQ